MFEIGEGASENVAIEANFHLERFVKQLKGLTKGGIRVPVTEEEGEIFG
jgi:hypothetical protein